MRAHLSKAARSTRTTEATSLPTRAPASGGRISFEHRHGLPLRLDRTGQADGLRAAAEAISGVPLDDRRVQPRARAGGLLSPLVQSAKPSVVQRSVLHKINKKGEIVYYSDLEKPPQAFSTREEAEKLDEELAGKADVLADALTTNEKPPRERRVPTPFGHFKTKPSAKVRHQAQGPHSLSFSAIEQRIQNRLRKGQYKELAGQVVAPEDAGARFKSEYGVGEDDDRYKRYMLDYKSLYAEFDRLLKDDKTDFGLNSRFHLVARKLLQLHPYTTYRGPKSTNLGEDRHGILGANLDEDALKKFKDPAQYETYLQTREDLFHSSDEEEEGHKPKRKADPHKYIHVKQRPRKYARKKEEGKKEESKKEETKEEETKEEETEKVE